MDLVSLLAGALIGIFSTIITYEYTRWRERRKAISEKRKQVIAQLRSELNKVVTCWETFEKTEEMHVDPGLSNFQRELESLARVLRNIALASEALVSKSIIQGIMEIVNMLIKLSQARFFLDGGKSWSTFFELGSKMVTQCKELVERLA